MTNPSEIDSLDNLPLDEVERKIREALFSDRELPPSLRQMREDFRKWLNGAKPGPEDYDLVLRNPDGRHQGSEVLASGMLDGPGG